MNLLLNDLKGVRTLLSKPENWLQGKTAVDKYGNLIAAESIYACAWCLGGAWQGATNLNFCDKTFDTFCDALIVTAYNMGVIKTTHITIAQLNDMIDHQTVLKILDKAIEYEEDIC